MDGVATVRGMASVNESLQLQVRLLLVCRSEA